MAQTVIHQSPAVSSRRKAGRTAKSSSVASCSAQELACISCNENTHISAYMYMYMYEYKCISTYLSICLSIYLSNPEYLYFYIVYYTYIHTYIHTYMHTYMHTYIHAYIHGCGSKLWLSRGAPPLLQTFVAGPLLQTLVADLCVEYCSLQGACRGGVCRRTPPNTPVCYKPLSRNGRPSLLQGQCL